MVKNLYFCNAMNQKQRLLAAFCLLLAFIPMTAQQTRSLSDNIKTVRVIVKGDPLLPPVTEVGNLIMIDFDEMSHMYYRFIYHIDFCNADWTVNEELFESSFMTGFNNRPIEDYEKSLNTSQIYTHYRFFLPNDDVQLLLPGNYRVTIYNEDDDEDDRMPVAEACFSLLEQEMPISATVSSNTDIDFNISHQQLTYSVNFNGNTIVNPLSEIKTVVLQNRRWENAVVNLEPNMRTIAGLGWTYRKPLIFEGGNEFRKFEILDVRLNGMNVDRMTWHEPYRHATLFEDKKPNNYVLEHDVNGSFIIRAANDDLEENDIDTQAEYLFVHFVFKSDRLSGGDVYVDGGWTNGSKDPRCKMKYNDIEGYYETAVLLKQGYYDYRYVQYREDGHSTVLQTEGSFFQTENEYIILVYYRPQGARYDALVGYTCLTFKQ